MNEQEMIDFEQRIVIGVNRSFKRLITEKKKVNEELVFANNGRVFKMKAADFEKLF